MVDGGRRPQLAASPRATAEAGPNGPPRCPATAVYSAAARRAASGSRPPPSPAVVPPLPPRRGSPTGRTGAARPTPARRRLPRAGRAPRGPGGGQVTAHPRRAAPQRHAPMGRAAAAAASADAAAVELAG